MTLTSEDVSGILKLVGAAALIAVGFWIRSKWIALERQRWQLFASQQNLQFYNRLPMDLLPRPILNRLPFLRRPRFCVTGERNGERVITFQQYSWGNRSGRWITAVGCEQQHPERYTGTGSLTIRMIRDGRWVILSARSFTGIKLNEDEILRAWDALRTTDDHSTLNGVDSGIVIRPRHEKI